MTKEHIEEYKQHQAMLKELRGEIRDKLKECKDEWLEKNQKGQPALGVLTVQQILDYATGGLWSFRIEEQWREDVSKFDKGSKAYHFDGFVYHVRGHLEIEGLGVRTQYGSKVAIGGKDNQNSAYKSAASDCLKKCASLFGVGSSIYSKVKVEEDEYTQLQQDPNYMVGQQQSQQPETYVNPQGYHQNGEYVYFNNNWVHQNEFYAFLQQQQAQSTNGGQYPSPGLTEEQQRNQWHHDTMQQNDPQGYQRMIQEQQQAPVQQTLAPEEQLQQQRSAEITQTINEVDQEMAAGKMDVPFNGQPVQQQTEVVTQEFQAEQQPEAIPQAPAEQQNYQAVEYGAPASPETAEPKKEEDPLKDVQANNPWNTAEIQGDINQFAGHKTRLGIQKDADLLPYIRDYFKDEKAGLGSITPDVLPGFNAHLQNIAV